MEGPDATIKWPREPTSVTTEPENRPCASNIPELRWKRRGSHFARRDESGSSLILALVFLIVGSLIVSSLANWTTNDLKSSAGFRNAGYLLYAAGGVTQVAMWNSRYQYSPQIVSTTLTAPALSGQNQASLFDASNVRVGSLLTIGPDPGDTTMTTQTLTATSISGNVVTFTSNLTRTFALGDSVVSSYLCPGTDTQTTANHLINGYKIEDWCSTSLGYGAFVTRRLTLWACVVPSGSPTISAQCTNPILTAVVDFDDATNASQVPANCTASNPTNCGAYMTLESWKAQQGS